MALTTCALSEPRPVGFILDAGPFGRVRITAEITRDEYFRDLEERRRWDRDHGLPAARAGTYTEETREYIPGKQVPETCQYFYRVEPVGGILAGIL